MLLKNVHFWSSLFRGKMVTLEICKNGLLKNYKCALFCGSPWRELTFSWENLKEAGRRRRYGPLSKPKQLILPYVYLGMDGISCGLIKGDYREGGNGGRCCRSSHAAGDLSNTLLWEKACAWTVLQYCLEAPEVGSRCLAPLGLWELELRGSSVRQGDAQAHLAHPPAVPWGPTWASLGFSKQREGKGQEESLGGRQQAGELVAYSCATLK